MTRVLRGLAALIILVGLLVGIPVGLAVFGGNPLPGSLSWPAIAQALLTPASDQTLVGIVTILGWIAWAGFALCVAAELANTLSGRRIHLQLPGLGVGQKLAAALIITVVAMLAAPHTLPTAAAEPVEPTPTATVTAAAHPGTDQSRADQQGSGDVGPPAARQTRPAVEGESGPAQEQAAADRVTRPQQGSPSAAADHGPRQVVHVVQRGEWLWTLADRYLGDGSQWREIADANPGISPDHLAVGQKLIIPVVADSGRSSDTRNSDTITVERGDSLSSISDDLYDTENHWRDLYRENKEQISDPDLIDVGQILQLPDTDHQAHPGHQITQHDSQDQATDRQRDKQPPPTQPGDTANQQQGTATQSPGPSAGPTAQPSATASTEPHQPAEPAPAPTHAARSQAAPTHAAPGKPAPTAEEGSSEAGENAAPVAAVSVGLLLAAGLLTTVNLRRRRQLRARPPGRRIATPEPEAREFEQAVKAQHESLRVEQLDQVTRALAAHCHHTGQPVPALSAVRVADHRIDLLLQRPADNPPPGIEVAADGSVWTLHAANIGALLAVDGMGDATPPYPALVTLGRDADTAHILIDLEAAAALTITADNADTAAAMLATIALELAVSPWAADLNLTFVGPLLPGFAEALDHPSVTHLDDLELVLAGLEARAAGQRPHLDEETVGQKRVNPELADAWCPDVVLLGQDLTPDQSRRLADIVTELPRVAIAAVTTTSPAITPWQLRLARDAATAQLAPHDWQLTPQLVTADQYQHMLALITTSGSDETTPAPWWDHDADADPIDQQPKREASVTVLPTAAHATGDDAKDEKPAAAAAATRTSMTLHALTTADPTSSEPTTTPPRRARWTEPAAPEPGEDELDLDALTADADLPHHPTLRILGQPDLVGTNGAPNSRYQQRSMEFLLYLLEHPGTTNARLTSEFCISRDYTKSVISNLRKTLGADPDGRRYLPEVEARGGYRLHEVVTSDWQQATRLIGRGVNNAAPENLARILTMVRGRPLEGAEDWVGTDTLRPDIISTLVDVAHELADFALDRNDLRLARWATAQGLLAAPDSETLLTDRLRTEDQAGNRTDVQRLAGRISANARALGVDLLDETREVLRATARL